MIELTVKCKGLSAMLMNPMTEETLDSLITGVRKPIVKDRPISDVAAERIYRNLEGQMGFPAINLIGALKLAGRKIKNGKKGISTATTTELFSYFEFPEEFITFDDLDDKGGIPWRTDKRRGVMRNGASSVAVGIIRPRFDNWGFTVKVGLHENLLRSETAKALFVEAGSNAGLCDFRPSKNGPFGRFKVVEFHDGANGNGKK
jgi:hypothetical protein